MAVEGMNDMAEGMQCTDHPYRSNNAGGICASCLQEKLGKLVSSSFPLPLLRSSSAAISSSSSAASPIRSKPPTAADSSSSSAAAARDVPFFLGIVAKKKKNKKVMASSTSSSSADNNNVVFKRSKSTASVNRRGFWSFLHLSSSSSTSFSSSESKASSKSTAAPITRVRVRKPESEAVVSVSEEVDDVASFDRKVSRSRSVGCGSRSFSGDFFERISTGFGDCTLRRVESQREGKSQSQSQSHARCMKERVRCGGIFGGFILTSSSSSTSSEWDVNGPRNGPGSLVHGRAKSWGWAFASPIRAFAKPNGPNNGKRDIIRQASEKSASSAATTPNLAAIPSLLSARG